MAGYVIGTKAWYNKVRERLTQISEMLKSPEVSQEKKDELYEEQIALILDVSEYYPNAFIDDSDK